MINIIILICILGIILSVIFEKNIYNPIFIFSSIWGSIFLIYKFNPYDMPIVEKETVLCMMYGICFFIIGGIFIGNIRITHGKIVWIKPNNHYPIKKYINDFFNEKIIIIIQIMGTFIYMYLGYSGLIAFLSGNNLSYIRYNLRLQTLESGINGILISYVVAPIMYFSITYTASNIAIHNFSKNIKISLACSLTMLVMDLMTVGGRMGILYTLVAMFVCFFIFRKKKEKTAKNKATLLFFIVFIFGIYVMWSMAASRGGTALKDTIVYLYAPISCFDRYREIFHNNGYDFTLGLLSTQGFTRPIFKLLSLSHISLIENVDRVYELIDSDIWLNTQRFNSETTFMGYFYFDGGNFIVCLFSAIFGFFCQKYYRKIVQTNCLKVSSLCYYIVMLGTIALSFIQFSFASIGFSLSVVWIFIMSSLKNGTELLR